MTWQAKDPTHTEADKQRAAEMHSLFDKPARKKPVKRNPACIVNYTWKLRYQQSHEKWFAKKYPAAYNVGGYVKLTFPKTETGNGLNRAIEQFLTWEGHRATRVSSAGRVVNGVFIRSTTRRGAADVSSTINGRSCQWEGKAGKDQPRDEQLREQIIERKAGGVYEFVHDMNEMFLFYDQVLNREI